MNITSLSIDIIVQILQYIELPSPTATSLALTCRLFRSSLCEPSAWLFQNELRPLQSQQHHGAASWSHYFPIVKHLKFNHTSDTLVQVLLNQKNAAVHASSITLGCNTLSNKHAALAFINVLKSSISTTPSTPISNLQFLNLQVLRMPLSCLDALGLFSLCKHGLPCLSHSLIELDLSFTDFSQQLSSSNNNDNNNSNNNQLFMVFATHALAKFTKLQQLNLSCCTLDDTKAAILASTLQVSEFASELRVLDLGGKLASRVDSADLVAAFGPLKLVSINNKLQNHIGNAGVSVLADAIGTRCPNLISLDLSFNDITTHGAHALFKTFFFKQTVEVQQKQPMLQKLNVASNEFSLEDLLWPADTVDIVVCADSLQYLDVQNLLNPCVGREHDLDTDGKKLANVLKQMKQLRTLLMNGLLMTNTMFKHVVPVLPELQHLETLEISANKLVYEQPSPLQQLEDMARQGLLSSKLKDIDASFAVFPSYGCVQQFRAAFGSKVAVTIVV